MARGKFWRWLLVGERLPVTMELVKPGGGAAKVNVWIVSSQNETEEEGGNIKERREMEIEVGTGQPDFKTPTNDVDPVRIGDKWRYQGREFSTYSTARKDPEGRMYLVKLVSKKTVFTGA